MLNMETATNQKEQTIKRVQGRQSVQLEYSNKVSRNKKEACRFT